MLKQQPIINWDNLEFVIAGSGRNYPRQKIRVYFNNTCQNCGKKWEEGKRRFDVHHINGSPEDTKRYDKLTKQDFENSNLEKKYSLLCHKCHLNLPETKEKMKNAIRIPHGNRGV